MMLQSLSDCYTLSNGVKIPCIGFGTYKMPEGAHTVEAVSYALQNGYRHIDTAEMYGNEKSVGLAMRQSGLSREQIFLTSKLNNGFHGYEKTVKALNDSLAALDTDYLDLFLIHWPNPLASRNSWQQDNAGTWRAFEEFYRAGKLRAIGISNFRPHHIEELMKTAEIAPMVNQIRLCPGETQDEVVDYCRAHDILLEAYSPLGQNKALSVAELQTIAAHHERTVAQVCIRWSLQRGYLPLPKTVTPARILENSRVFDFALTDEEVEQIAGLVGCAGFCHDPDTTQF